MKITLHLLILMTLTTSGATIECYNCNQTKLPDKPPTTTCGEGKITASCPATDDACVKSDYSYKADSESGKTEIVVYQCGLKSKKDDPCDTFKADVKDHFQNYEDFKCKSKFCDKRFCNAGQAAKTSLLVLAVTGAIFGLFY